MLVCVWRRALYWWQEDGNGRHHLRGLPYHAEIRAMHSSKRQASTALSSVSVSRVSWVALIDEWDWRTLSICISISIYLLIHLSLSISISVSLSICVIFHVNQCSYSCHNTRGIICMHGILCNYLNKCRLSLWWEFMYIIVRIHDSNIIRFVKWSNCSSEGCQYTRFIHHIRCATGTQVITMSQ